MKTTILRINLLCTVFLAGMICFSAFSQTVDLWMTSGSGGERLQYSTESFGSASGSATITVNEGTTYQSIDGFGFTLTQASAKVISQMSSGARSSLLNELFGSSGLDMGIIRIGIGATDLSDWAYSYRDGASFSLEGPDLEYTIPILQQILAIDGSIKVLATPWSAPMWMKSPQPASFTGGTLAGEYYDEYAQYWLDYMNAMRNQGIEIWGITPQNEPLNPYNTPSMTLTKENELGLINDFIGPTLRNAGYNCKIICYDHNCDNTEFPIYVANNSSYVDGSAFHLYAGDISALTTVRNSTGKNVYFTEQYTSSEGSFSGDLNWHMQNVMIGSLNNWSKTAFEWNLAADQNNGPYIEGTCSTCMGGVTVNGDNVTRNVGYYNVGQMSKVIKANAVRIGSSSNNGSLINTAVKNSDGSIGLVVFNTSGSTITFNVSWNGSSFDYSLGGGNVVSFRWSDSGPVTGIPVPGIIEAEDYSSMSGIDTESCSEGGENVGWVDPGDWCDYYVDVASSGNYTVNFRVAADGSDAKSVQLQAGSSTATANFTATGGWQNWTTTTSEIYLNAGSQTVRLYFPVAGINVNYIDLLQGVTPVLTSIVVSPSSATLDVGETQQFTATGYDQNGNTMSISPSWSGTNSSGLFIASTAGTYTVTASQSGVSGSATVVVNSVDPGITIPGRIEAEDYSAMSGIDTESCSEGGENVGWVDAGDWCDYNVNVTASGTYTVNFRVAADGSDAKSVQLQAGGSTATASFTATGGWQNWTTATSEIYLSAGSQTVRLYFPVSGINVNYVDLVSGVTPVLTTIQVSPSSASLQVGQTQQFTATGYDQNGNVMSISPSWSGTNSGGLFTATSTGTYTVTASQSGVSGSATVVVSSEPTGEDITDLGGTVSAQYDDSPSAERYPNLIDNNVNTKYLTFHASGWAQYQAPGTYIVTGYSITSANDAPERDPLSWTLQGSNNGSSWTTIDSRSAIDFPNRFQTLNFEFGNTSGYIYYRLNMNNNSGSVLQLAEWELFGTEVTGTDPWTVTIQAEDYFEMYGVQTENTSDDGGGLNVGWIDGGDWMGYTVDLPAADVYTVEYRIASPSGDGNLQLEVFGGGTVYGSLDMQNTDGWQNWTTISHTANFPSGQQDLAIVANSAGWNINWFALTRGIKSAETESFDLSGITVYPNPANNILIVEGLSEDSEFVTVIDVLGREYMRFDIQEDTRLLVDISELESGLYILRFTSEQGKHQSTLFRKQ